MVLIPVGDDAPVRAMSPPLVTWALIGLCVTTHLWLSSLSAPIAQHAIATLGATPALITGDRAPPPGWEPAPPLTLVTSLFLHGDWLHLAGNMLFLWVFGDNVEDATGRLRFLLFYLLCGVAATLVYVVSDPTSTAPLIGASGAVAGVLGAYLVLYPRAKIAVMIFIGVFAHVRAVIVLGAWIGFQVFSALRPHAADDGGVAWWAHVGGFFIGAALIAPLRRRGVRLFSPAERPRRASRRRSVFPSSRGRR